MKTESDFSQPIRNLQKMLQTVFRSEGVESRVIPDGIYCRETADAVSTFQRSHGLPVTGSVNQETWDLIVECYTPAQILESDACPLCIPMRKNSKYAAGDENSNIMLMQCMLQEISKVFQCICPPSVNGVMDEATCLCIEQMQELCGIPVNGEMDMLTWKNLALCYPVAYQCHQT